MQTEHCDNMCRCLCFGAGRLPWELVSTQQCKLVCLCWMIYTPDLVVNQYQSWWMQGAPTGKPSSYVCQGEEKIHKYLCYKWMRCSTQCFLWSFVSCDMSVEGVICSFFGLSTPCHVASTVQCQLWMFGESPSVLSLFLWCAVTNKGDNTMSSYGLAEGYGRKSILFLFN